MSRPGPHTQTELAAKLEEWYSRRSANVQLRGGAMLAPWELDKVFMALALSLWPVDMEASQDPHYQTTHRMRMRLRHEGYEAIVDAANRLLALAATADYAREQLKRTEP